MITIYLHYDPKGPNETLHFLNYFEQILREQSYYTIRYPSDPLIGDRPLLTNADAFVTFSTDQSLTNNTFFINDYIAIKNYADNAKKYLTVLHPGEGASDPLAIKYYNDIFWNSENQDLGRAKELVDYITKDIAKFDGANIATVEREKLIKEQINNSAESFVTTTTTALEKREGQLRNTAIALFLIAFILIVVSFMMTWSFANQALSSFSKSALATNYEKFKKTDPNLSIDLKLKQSGDLRLEKMDWSLFTFFTVKSLLILSLILAACKYCFSLGKSFMIESLRLSDRVHAIRFGQFYLQLYSNRLEPNELKEAFSDWNLNVQNAAFSTSKGEDWDPKYIERILDVLSKYKEIVR